MIVTKSVEVSLHRNWVLFELSFAFVTAAFWPYFMLKDGLPSFWELIAQLILLMFLIEHVWVSTRALWLGQWVAFTKDGFEVNLGVRKIVSIPFKDIECVGGKHRIWFGGEYGPPDRIGIKLKPNAKHYFVNEFSPLYSITPFKRWNYVTRFSYQEPVEIMLEHFKARGVHIRT